MNCSSCDETLTNWDYRYRGEHYCRKCYDTFFQLKQCVSCGKRKMIFLELKIPICKICQVNGKPCIRCGKIEYVHGKITADGPVCNSCIKYFKIAKSCKICGTVTHTVSNRSLLDGTKCMMCQSCYNRILPICHKCGKQRKAYVYEQNKPICKICAIEEERTCIQCGKSFPAGRGQICRDCSYENMLQRKLLYGSRILSDHMSDLFVRFGKWLRLRRGVMFAALHVNRYFLYFSQLDDMAEKIGHIPAYLEIVAELTVAATRKNLLVTLFLDQEKIVLIDRTVQEEYANIDMMTRYCERFEEGTWANKVLDSYLEQLENKSSKNSIRSTRLAIGTAANLLSYMKSRGDKKINENTLNGYLWKYPGQKSSVTGFINHLNRQYDFKLTMPQWTHPELVSPKNGHIQLEQKLIDMLRDPIQSREYNDLLIRTAIAYLHGVDIPINVRVNIEDIKHTKFNNYILRLAGREFYLPKEVKRSLYSK